MSSVQWSGAAVRTVSGKPASRQAVRSSSDSSHQASCAPCPAWAIDLPADMSRSGFIQSTGAAGSASAGGSGSSRSVPETWSRGQVLGPAVERDRREDPDLGRLPGDGDAGQRLGPPPLGAARPPDDLADPGVLPVPHRLRPLPLPQRPLVAEHHQDGTGRGLQRVRTPRRFGLLDTHDQGQHVLRCLVAGGPLVPEGAVLRGCPAGWRLVVVHALQSARRKIGSSERRERIADALARTSARGWGA